LKEIKLFVSKVSTQLEYTFELNATTFNVKLKSLTFHFSSNCGCVSLEDDHASLWRTLLVCYILIA